MSPWRRTRSGTSRRSRDALPEGRAGASPVSLNRLLADQVLAVRASLAELEGDLGAVHDARVALRRLRAMLAVFGPVLEDVPAGLLDELRRISRRLAPTRDIEIVAERLQSHLTGITDPETRAIVEARLAHGTDRAARRATAALAGRRTAALLADLDQLPPDTRHEPVIYQEIQAPRLARLALEDLCDAFGLLAGTLPDLRPRQRAHLLHVRRKQAKTVRATLVALDTTPALRTHLHKAIGRLQNLLGEYQDAVVVRAWLRDLSAAEPETAAWAHDVRRSERAAMTALEKRLPAAIAHLVDVGDRARRTPAVHLASS